MRPTAALSSEQAALVALLHSRPNNAWWPEITANVLERGSARAVWDEANPPDLFADSPANDALVSAATEIESWARDTPSPHLAAA